MAQQSKREYVRSIYHRYHQAGKEDKGMILDEFAKICRYHRKNRG